MIKVKKLNYIPDTVISMFVPDVFEKWPTSAAEIKQLFSQTNRFWILSVEETYLGVVGLVKKSLIGNGQELYFMPCVGIKKHKKLLIKFFRKAVKKLGNMPVRLSAQAENNKNCKFLLTIGFSSLYSPNTNSLFFEFKK